MLDNSTGQFTYYCDNKKPGHELHDTPRRGNALLSCVIEAIHGQPARCDRVPPFFIFQAHPTPVSSRSFQFRGLAAPGYAGLPAISDLVAVWKTTDGQRFQNYRSVFTVLDVPTVPRAWIDDVLHGQILSEHCPPAWREWVQHGRYAALASETTTNIRSIEEQTPQTPQTRQILEVIWEMFGDRPIEFERFAAKIFRCTTRE